MGRKNFSFVFFLLRFFLLVLGTYDTLKFLIYQNFGNTPLMLKNYTKDALILILILKQHFVFYEIAHNSLQFFDIFHNNQLKLSTLLCIVSVKNVK